MTKEQLTASNFLWNSHSHALQLIAGAGSGKTTTLIQTVQNCITNNYSPEKISLITFSKKSAEEMKHRLGEKQKGIGFVGTMHALAYSLLSKYLNKKISIVENQDAIYKQIIETKFPNLKHIPVEFLFNNDHHLSLNLMQEYSHFKKEHELYDFEDLIIEASQLLHNKEIPTPFDVIFVDEFQDTSPIQLSFIQKLNAKKLFVVGDDWQSIYKFRGADVSITMNFNKHFHSTKRLFLTKNFRSQSHIVELGNKTIRKLSSEFVAKKLTPHFKAANKPICHLYSGKISEIEQIKKTLEWSFYKYGKQNITILTRTNYTKSILEATIISLGLSNLIQVLTIHASKGLEFDHVMIAGIAKNQIPHKWGDSNEETRLFYVGITRAKQSLQFIAHENGNHQSIYLPFLTKYCKIMYH